MFIIKYLIVAVLLLPLSAFASDWSVPTKVLKSIPDTRVG